MSTADSMTDQGRSDSRRLLAAFLAAVLLHIVAFIAFAIVRFAENAMNPPPVSVELLPGALGGPALAGPPETGAQQSSSARTAARPGVSPEPSFVIPTPRSGAGSQATQPTGPAFRVAGPSSAQTSSAPEATSPVQEPVFSHVTNPQAGTQTVTGGGGATAGGPAQGVLVEGGGQAAATGSLDLGSLDKSLAAAQGSGSEPGVESGGGGSGQAGVGTGGGGKGAYRFQWDQPEAAKDRRLLASPQPRIPQWVSKQGLSLTVLVAFTLTPDGLLRDVTVEGSSGWNDVDAAVTEAVRSWKFSPDPAAHNIHGLIPYIIRAR
ncbi:MAG TPA: TonB family protein [Spirochaetia bacterium]|nr:TonB family protein [Spirochaetia bacterium]